MKLAKAKLLLRMNRYSEAERLLTEILPSGEQDPEIFSVYGRCLIEDGHIVEAVECFARATRLMPKDVESWLLFSEGAS